MLVVVSPAKRLDWSERQFETSEPEFATEASRLAGHARQLTLGGLKQLMHLSDDLARLNRERFRSFTDKPEPDTTRPAIYGFSGDTYIGFDAGSLDDEGRPVEEIYDVALSDDRSRDADGKIPPVGNTVDLATGHYTNSIGDAELAVVWEDPNFDANERAFYYVRVLQIPTPRHTLYDAIALGIPVEETGHPATIQERAYSSPIWYTP